VRSTRWGMGGGTWYEASEKPVAAVYGKIAVGETMIACHY
jgi:hypothetical protein